ncbi:glucose PTS transporter subunit IIA [Lacticaseibacillus camelliae]|nr:glucose PTS transporter subunit IIA [Lacticaseibacillus camelliae]
MDNHTLASAIVADLGGKQNITNYLHCVTRLRFSLADGSKADMAAIGKLQGVLGAKFQNNQYQVVIGPNVSEVYDAVVDVIGADQKTAPAIASAAAQKRKLSANVIFTAITDIFSPILPALVAGGILKGILAIVVTIAPVLAKNSTYALFSLISDVPFYFLPFLLAVSSARKFKLNEFLGLCMAGALLYPTFTATIASGKSGLSLFGLTIPTFTYSTSVFPVILGVGLMAIVYHFIDRYVPEVLKMVVVPALTLAIAVPIAMWILAPLGAYGGQYLATGIVWLFKKAGLLAGFLLGFFMPLIVLTGMHQSTSPIQIQNIATLGYDYLLPISFCHNMAEAGAAFGAALRMKDKEMRSAAMSTSFSAFLGISEPALYTVNVVNKTPFISAMIANGIGGALTVIFSVKCYAFVMPGITSLPVYAKAGNLMNMVWIVVCIAATFLLSAVLSFALGHKISQHSAVEQAQAKTAGQTALNDQTLAMPVDGNLIPLSQVPDATFAAGTIGAGFAVEPTDGIVVSPIAGKITNIFSTKHAITIEGEGGINVLIHMGIDTVELKGAPFTLHVAEGDTVAAGQALADMDLDAIKDHGKNADVIVVFPELPKNVTLSVAAATGPKNASATIGDLVLA